MDRVSDFRYYLEVVVNGGVVEVCGSDKVGDLCWVRDHFFKLYPGCCVKIWDRDGGLSGTEFLWDSSFAGGHRRVAA